MIVAGTLLLGVVSIESARDVLEAMKYFVVDRFDWLFVVTVNVAIVISCLFAVHPYGRLRLGPPDSEPDFSRLSWFAMLFSAGLASGLLYWATAEPILHSQENPFIESGGGQGASAETLAMRITLLHWGIHGWALYVVAALSIAIAVYRHAQPLRFRSALYLLLGEERIQSWVGGSIDLIALLGTVAGVATSIGLSAVSINATFASMAGIQVGTTQQLAIIGIVCALGICSALVGLARGVRRLSELNVWVSTGLLCAFLLLGPTWTLFELFAASLVDYVLSAIPVGVWIGETASERSWQADWTIFYWGWWLAWTPFVSLFIARISKGRTIREFVLAVLFVPSVVTLVWMVALGGTALFLESSVPGSISEPVNRDFGLGLVVVIERLGSRAVGGTLVAVASFLLLTWLITSLDSAVLVICHLLGVEEVAAAKIVWGTCLAAVAALLLRAGGLVALQSASIVLGFPLALIVLGIGIGLVSELVRTRS